MIYENMLKAIFIKRPNRFIAHCLVKGEKVKVHVKNTGRCQELLIPGTEVYLQSNNNPNRKTKYSLISVKKGDRLINIDSQVPNQVVSEALAKKIISLPGLTEEINYLKAEQSYQQSRFDFYFETDHHQGFIEVKGVTLEEEGVVLFPDAPTQRGLKHLHELIKAKKEGYLAYVFFLVQMENVKYFTPNMTTHQAFGEALALAKSQGVEIAVYDSKVTKDSIKINKLIPYKI